MFKYVGYGKRREHTHTTVIYLWAQVGFIVEITYPKIKITKQLLKLTTLNWVQYYISDKQRINFFLNYMYKSQKIEKVTSLAMCHCILNMCMTK